MPVQNESALPDSGGDEVKSDLKKISNFILLADNPERTFGYMLAGDAGRASGAGLLQSKTEQAVDSYICIMTAIRIVNAIEFGRSGFIECAKLMLPAIELRSLLNRLN